METVTLSREAVDAYKELMTNPKPHGLDFPPLSELFQPAEVSTPRHLLFEQYKEMIGKPLPKVFFYIVMDEVYADRIKKAPTGEMGYALKLVNNSAFTGQYFLEG